MDLDRLLRGERRQGGDMTQVRSEAARILMTGSSHSGMRADDRTYLVRLVSANTGLSQPDADRRVTEVSASAKENIDRARRAAGVLAFMAAAAALAGAAAAWYAAVTAGRHREGIEAVPDFWKWEQSYGRTWTPR